MNEPNAQKAGRDQVSAALPWYRKEGWIVALLILFAPVGIYLLWRYTTWPRKVKQWVTVASAAFFVFAIVQGQLEKTQRNAEAPKEAVPAAAPPTASAQQAEPNPLGVRSDFQPSYSILEEKRVDAGAVPRLSLRVAIPNGVTGSQIETNVQHALWDAWRRNQKAGVSLGAVGLFAYRPGDDYQGVYTVAKADFAPDGEWSKADPKVPIEQWRASIVLAAPK